jgi:hypothetical protein
VRTAFLFFSPLDYFAGAPLSTAVSRLRRSSSTISCSTITATSHCPFLTRSSSSFHARTAQNIAPTISFSAAVLNSSRTKVPPLLLPRQEHHQHHISMSKLPNQFPFAFLHSSRRTTVTALGSSLRRLCF